MVIQRGEIWWASLPEPAGSEPGYRRPVLVIQSNDFIGHVTLIKARRAYLPRRNSHGESYCTFRSNR